jgi:uncharacterized membrane protein
MVENLRTRSEIMRIRSSERVVLSLVVPVPVPVFTVTGFVLLLELQVLVSILPLLLSRLLSALLFFRNIRLRNDV